MLLWCVVSINNNFWGIQILVGSGHDKLYSKCFQIGVIATIVLNYIFIRIMGVWGASIAPLVSEAFLGVLLLICVNNLKKAQLTT
jgi:PST family polysaccharide transporter